jgi:hypothetical protein
MAYIGPFLKFHSYVLTPLPEEFFQVFQVKGGEEERENREYITNTHHDTINLHFLKCFSISKSR